MNILKDKMERHFKGMKWREQTLERNKVFFFFFQELYIVLKKTLDSALDCKKIKPVIPKGNQP